MTNTPPRSLRDRIRDTRARLEGDIDLWLATAGEDGAHLLPLSYLWDGSALLVSTSLASVTGRNLSAGGRVLVGLGPTRDVVMIDGTVARADLAGLPPGTGDAFAERTGFDPRELDGYGYFLIRPHSVQAWREVNEMPGRTLMRDGRWLDDAPAPAVRTG